MAVIESYTCGALEWILSLSWNYLNRNPSLACTFLATGTEADHQHFLHCSSDPHVSDKGAAGAQRGDRGDTMTLVRV